MASRGSSRTTGRRRYTNCRRIFRKEITARSIASNPGGCFFSELLPADIVASLDHSAPRIGSDVNEQLHLQFQDEYAGSEGIALMAIREITVIATTDRPAAAARLDGCI